MSILSREAEDRLFYDDDAEDDWMDMAKKTRRTKKSGKSHGRYARRIQRTLAAAVGVLGLGIGGSAAFSEGPLQPLSEKLQLIFPRIEEFARELVTPSGMSGMAEGVQSLEELPAYQGESYVTVHNNIPVFTQEERLSLPHEYYSPLDALGRCGPAQAKITPDMMPTEERGSIGAVKPTGWHTIKYEGIDGNYLYNRCHLIGYQLAGENANEKNLITGTRYLNVVGMLPWENLVAEYIKRTGDCVLYRVTPVFEGNNLVASGVEMEALSLGSDEISFHIYVFNVQPGIGIDYRTGESWKLSIPAS